MHVNQHPADYYYQAGQESKGLVEETLNQDCLRDVRGQGDGARGQERQWRVIG
jgi:hypothetical protein